MKSFRLGPGSADLRYHDVPGDGTPLLFIHGLGCASSCDYPRVAADAALAGRRMLLVDLLGFGFSDRPADFGYTIDDHARSVGELVRGLDFEAVDLFGHSMGGSIAIVAASLLADRARHLAVGEPNLEPGGGRASRKIAEMPEADYVARGHDELVRTARAEGNDIWAASLSISAPYAVHRGATSLVRGSDPTWRAVLSALTMPRTVIVGEASIPNPNAEAERLSREGLRLSVVARAGHAMALENPAGLATAIQRALA
jgi:pimeloyl-ACP methyl ester carboxylesterase